MLRKCASIDEYLDNEWKIYLLGWDNICNIKQSDQEIPPLTILGDIELKDDIWNYRKLILTSSDEAVDDSIMKMYESNNQIVESVCSHIIPVPNKRIHRMFQFSFPLFDYNSTYQEYIVQAVIIDGKHLRLMTGSLFRNYGSMGQEFNSFEIYGLGKRNFVKEKKLKVFYGKFHKNNTSFYYKHL